MCIDHYRRDKSSRPATTLQQIGPTTPRGPAPSLFPAPATHDLVAIYKSPFGDTPSPRPPLLPISASSASSGELSVPKEEDHEPPYHQLPNTPDTEDPDRSKGREVRRGSDTHSCG